MLVGDENSSTQMEAFQISGLNKTEPLISYVHIYRTSVQKANCYFMF